MGKLKTAIIFDIDGVLAQSEQCHLHKDEVAKGDYSWFREQIPYFEPEKLAKVLINNLAGKHRILFVTARVEECRKPTEKWLKDNFQFVPYFPFKLFMRPDDNHDADEILKKSIYHAFIKDKYQVIFAIDDKNKVLTMWRKDFNIPTLQAKY